MFVITLAPLAAIPQPSDQLLHYFSQQTIARGQWVDISLHGRLIPGVVFACSEAGAMRIAIKNFPYSLKKISSIRNDIPAFSQMQLESASWIASYYYASLGTVLQAMLRSLSMKPSRARSQRTVGESIRGRTRLGFSPEPYGFPQLNSPRKRARNAKSTTPAAMLCVGGCPEKNYRAFLSSARRKQCLVLVPERKDIEPCAKKIQAINPRSCVRIFHAGMNLSERRTVARDALAGMPLTVIGTRSALFLPLPNLAAIIVENPSDLSHASWDQNPHLNAVRVASWLYRRGFVALLFHEEQPGIELLHYARLNHWNIQISQEKKCSNGSMIDMRQELKNGNTSILSNKVQQILVNARNNKESVFLYVQRRGFASGIVCRDCGFIMVCQFCSVPMVYHSQPPIGGQSARKFLLCHRCKARQNAPTICPACKGSRIRFMSAGTERVEDEVKKLFLKTSAPETVRGRTRPSHDPDILVCRLDSDAEHSSEFLARLQESLTQNVSGNARLDAMQDTDKKSGQTQERVAAKCARPYVIIGTHYAWNFLPPQSMAVSAVVTIDGLLSLPDYRSQERIYGMIEKMKTVTRREFFVQTYCPEAPIYAHALADEWDIFEKKELALRNILKWPPFVQIIRMQYAHAQAPVAQAQAQQAMHLLQTQIKSLQRQGESDSSVKEDRALLETLSQCELLGPSPAFVDKVKNKYVWNFVLKWPVDEKGDVQNCASRNRLLAVLPRGWNIDVDPIDLV